MACVSRYMNKYQHTPYSGGAIFLFCLCGVFLFFRCFDAFVTVEKRKYGAKLFCVLVRGRMPSVRTVWLSFPPPLRYDKSMRRCGYVPCTLPWLPPESPILGGRCSITTSQAFPLVRADAATQTEATRRV